MDNEVVNDLFKRAVSLGYKKDLNSFVKLLHNDSEVLNDSYNYATSKGYKKSQDDFSLLVGLKKKDQPVVSQTGGYGSQLGSQTFQPTNQPAVLTEKGKKEAEKAELDQIRSQNIADKFKVNLNIKTPQIGFNKPIEDKISVSLPEELKVYRNFNAPTIQQEFAVETPEIKNNFGESITRQGGFKSDFIKNIQKEEAKPTTIGEDLEYLAEAPKRGVATGLKGLVTLTEAITRNPLRVSPLYWATKYIDEDLTSGVDGFFSNLSKKTQPYFDTAREIAGEALYTPTGTPFSPTVYEPKSVREYKKSRVEGNKSKGSVLSTFIGGALEYAGPAAVPYIGIFAHDAEVAREQLEQIQKANPNLKISDNGKDAWAIANGALGQLIFGQHGAAKLLNIEGLTGKLRDKVLKSLSLEALETAIKSGEKLTVGNINKYTSVAVDNFSKRLSLYGINAMNKVLSPVRDLTILEASKIAGERLVDAYRKNLGKTEEEQAPIFDNTLESDLSRIGQSAGTGAIFGFGGVGIGMATGQMPRLLRTDIINNNIADAIINYPDKADAIKAKMVEELRNKGISDDMIANTMADVDKAVSIASKLPADFPRKYRQKAVEILFDIDDLKELKKINEQKIIAAPDELKANYANETELINARIESKVDELRALHLGQEVKFSEEDGKYYKQIGNGPKEEITETRYLVDNPDKLERDAVQEQSTAGEVPPATEGGQNLQEGGEGVGQGVEGTQAPQEITQEEVDNRPISEKQAEAESKIKRKDLFLGVGEFSTKLGGSDKEAVPISHSENNGIEIVEYAHPDTGSVDVIVTGKSDNDFVGFYRIYENGKPTNKWSSKFENQSRNKKDFKTMISGVQSLLPKGHQYTEKTSISTDGLRVWNQQLEKGYEFQYDKNGKLITNLVAINGDSIINNLGIPVQKGDFENIKVKSEEEFNVVKKALIPYMEKFGLGEDNIKWLTGTVKIDLPVLLKSEKTTEPTQQGVKTVTAEVIQPASAEQARLHNEESGSTFTVDGVNRNGTKAASVSIFPERTKIVEGELTKEDIDGYVRENSDIYSGNEDVLAVGTWLDGKTGKTYLDVSVVLPKRRATILGKDYNQISVWDLEKGKEIPTGGTGEAVEGLKPELDRVKDIRRILGSQRGLKQAEVKKAETKPVVEETVDLASKIRGLKINTGKGRLQSNIAGLPIALYNSVVEAVALSVEAGSTIAEAIDKAIKKYNLDKVDGFDKYEFSKNIQLKNNPVGFDNIKKFASESSFNNKLEFKRAMQDMLEKNIDELKSIYGESFDPSKLNENTKQYLTDAITNESIDAISKHPESIGWYDEKTQLALKVMATIHPEIETDPTARGAFILPLAIMSNGNKVDFNFDLAEKQYEYFKKNGRFDTEGGFGIQQMAIKKSLEMINSMLDAGLTMNDLNEFFTSKYRAGDLKVNVDGKVKNLASGELADEPVYGAVILGPKIGNGFYMNLWGKFDQLTMDRWFMRTWGRLTGTLIDKNVEKVDKSKKTFLSALNSVKSDKNSVILLKSIIGDISGLNDIDVAKAIKKVSSDKDLRSKLSENTLTDALRRASNNLITVLDGEKEAPSNGNERKFIRGVFDNVLAKLKSDYGVDISMADLQAVLWYPEKILYESFKSGESFDTASEGYSSDSAPDYLNAAKKLVNKKGIDENTINQAIADRQRSSGAGFGETNKANGGENRIASEGIAQKIKTAISGKEIGNSVRKLKIDLGKGTAQSNIAGLPIALYNAAIETIALGLEAGVSLTDAIKNAIEKHKLLDKKKFDSNAFITDIENTTGQKFEGPKRVSGIRVSMVPKDIKAKANQVYQYDTMSDKEILETGRDLVESGAINVVSVVDEIAMNDEPRALQPNEVVAAIWYKADLDTKYEALLTERNEKFAKGEDVSSLDTQIATTQTSLDLYNKMAAITGRQQSLAFRLRKGLVDQDYNVQTRIEMYKKTNNGYIEPKLEQKFKDMAKELDTTKAEISRLEKEIASKEEELAIKNITENTKAQSRKINKSALSAAEQARKKQLANKFRTFNDITRMATLLVDKEFLEYAKLILKEASGEFSQFAKEIVDNVGKDIKEYLPELYKKVGGKGEADVSKLTGKALPKPSVDENGAIVIPPAFIKDLVKSGLTNIKDITEAVKAELIEALPDITSREVRDAITKYGKELKQTKDEITTQINTAKRIGRLYSKLEDLKAGRTKAKTPKQLNDISKEETNLRKQIKELGVKVSLPKGKKTLTDEQRVANRIKYLEKYIAEKQRRITEGDFSPKEKPKPLPQTQELIEAQARANRIRNEYDVAQYANEQANRSPFQKTYDFIIELTSGLSKSLKAGLDLSAFLGQGIIYFASTNPRTSIKTVAEAFKGAWSPEYEKKYMDKLKSSPTYYVMEGSGLRIQTPLTTFANVDVEKSTLAILTRLWNTLVSPLKYVNPKAYELAERFSPFAVTERAYTMTVNDMRVRMFVEFENSLMQDGKTFETDPNSFKIAANAVNNMTLSGRLRALEPLAKELNILFFSSRKVTAVLSLANPAYFVDVYRKDRVVGKKLLLKMATFVSMATAASVISNAFSDDDDSGNNPDIANPYSSDFMKIRVGSTRIDPFHGHLAPLILFARFITGNYKSTSSWEQKKLGQDQFTPTRLGLLTRYFGSKLSPSIVQAVKALDESAGNEVEWEDEAVNALKPIWTEDINELKESHPAVIGNFLSFLSYIGMSGSTFGAPFFLDPNNKEDEKLYKLINYQNAAFNLKSKSNIKILDGQTLEDRGMTAEEYEVYKKVYGDFIKSELLASYDDFRTMEHLTFEDKLKQIKSKANTLAKEKVSGLSEGIEKVVVKIGEEQVEYKLDKDEVDYRKSLNETYISKHSGLYRKYFKDAIKAGYNDIDADYIANRKLQQEANAYSKEKILKFHKQGKYYDFE